MLNINIISTIIGIFIGAGVMISACGYAYSTWKSGKNKYKDELIADLKSTVTIKESEIVRLNQERTVLITSHQKQLTELQQDFAELKGRFDEQAKKLQEYREILENRDPKNTELLNEIKNGIVKLNAHHVEDAKALLKAARKVENKTEEVK